MSVELPFKFINETPADADEVNANFDTLVNAINSHFAESNPHGITPELIGAALAVHTHTWNQIQNKPQSFPPSVHKHTWSDVKDVPLASLTTAGIVKLTSNRNSDSEELALTAKAMNAHRTSNDHDGRYYTKAQVDSLVGSAGMEMKWMVPDLETTFAWVTPKTGSWWEATDDWQGVASFTVTFPGTYLIYGTMRARVDDEPGAVAVCVPGWTAYELIPGNVTLSDVPPPGLGWASPIFETWNSSTNVSFYLEMYVPAPPGGAIIVVARQSRVNHVSINGYPGSAPPTRAWSRKN